MPPSEDQQKHSLGIVLLLVVVALWTGSSFLTSHILVGDESYEKPFFITWLQTSSFAFYLVPIIALRLRKQQKGKERSTPYTALDSTTRRHDDGPLTTRETAVLACQFCFLWFTANYAMNASLSLTTVSSMTVLSATSGLFTLFLGKMAAVETFNLAKLSAVLLSIVGVAMVSRSDSEVSAAEAESPLIRHRVLGDALALASAFLYSSYAIFLKLKIGSESRISMPLFLGFVGAANILLLWPCFILLHWSGMETFAAPTSAQIWASLLINALITFVADYLYIVAMLKTSPLLATVGLSLTIPSALLGDLFIIGTRVGSMLLFLLGAALVVAGFVIVGFAADDTTPLLREERTDISEDTA